jgi:hypothetical protein
MHAKRKSIPHDQGWKVLHHQCHKGKSNISLVSVNQGKNLNISSKKYVLLFLRDNHSSDKSVRVKASLEGCNKDKKIQELYRHTKQCFGRLKGYHLGGK